MKISIISDLIKKGNRSVSPSKWVKSFLVSASALLAVWTGAVFIVDPYIYWHKSRGLKQVYNNAYAQIPGILRNFDYDAVVIGSSMFQNFNLRDVNSIIGVNAVKATAPGLTFDDEGKIISVIFGECSEKVRRLIICCDLMLLGKDGHCGKWRDYRHLYNRGNPAAYILSSSTAGDLWDVLITNIASDDVRGAALEKDYCRMFCNKEWRHRYSRKIMESKIRRKPNNPLPVTAEGLETLKKQVLRPLGGNQDIRADLVLPPYSIYFWCLLNQKGLLADYLDARREIVAAAADFPNLRVHDFQSDTGICCNLDNYKDINHYSPEISRLTLKKIADGSVLASPSTIDKANSEIRLAVEKWMPDYIRMMEN